MGRPLLSLPLLEVERLFNDHKETPSIELINIINTLVLHIYVRNPERARFLNEASIKLATRLEYPRGRAYGILNRGHLALLSQEYYIAEDAVKAALLDAETLTEPRLEARALNLLCQLYQLREQTSDSLYFCLMARDIFAEYPNDLVGRALNGHLLGTSYRYLEEYPAAIRAYENAIAAYQRLKDTPRLIYVRWELAHTYCDVEAWHPAQTIAEAGLKACRPFLRTHATIAHSYGRYLALLATIFVTQGDVATARWYAEQGLEYYDTNELAHSGPYMIGDLMTALGKIRLAEGNVVEAYEATIGAYEMVRDVAPRRDLALMHEQLATVYKAMGNYKDAMEHLERHYELSRSQNTATQLERMRTIQRMSSTITVRRATSRLQEENVALQQVVSNLRTLHAQVKELSQRDSLTTLYNRRYLEEELPRLLDESHRTRFALTVAMVDVDNFKYINETYRHQRGDEIIRTIAAMIERHLQSPDFAVRYGGDEFLLVFPATPTTRARDQVETMCNAIASYVWERLPPDYAVTLSVGLATSSTDDTFITLIDRADTQLAIAKKRGKNQTATDVVAT